VTVPYDEWSGLVTLTAGRGVADGPLGGPRDLPAQRRPHLLDDSPTEFGGMHVRFPENYGFERRIIRVKWVNIGRIVGIQEPPLNKLKRS
jgi:hypothetical protein